MHDQQFRQLLDYFSYSWEGYRRVRKGVKKRVNRHMQELGCRSINEYFLYLDRDRGVRQQCECLMTVSVSHFFRDRLLWKMIEDQILPSIIEKNRKKVKFWFAGCACGEEVYSFKILWENMGDRFGHLPELEIWATDMNPAYLKRAQDGIYSLSSLKEVPLELRKIYFVNHGDKGLFRIAPYLKKGVLWKVHNLLSEFGEFNFQVIFLRNSILTYYKDDLKQSAFERVIDSLAKGNFLIIGSHEKLPTESKDLVPFSGQTYIFKKIGKEV